MHALDVLESIDVPVPDGDLVGRADPEDQVVATAPQRYRAGRNAGAELERVIQPSTVTQGSAGAVVVDGVLAIAHVEDVGVGRPEVARGDHIVTLAAFDGAPTRDRVVAQTPLDGVGSVVVGDGVIAVPAVDHVVACAAVEGVCTQPAKHLVVAVTAIDGVVTIATVQDVVTTEAVNGVVAGQPADGVVAVAAVDHVVAPASANCNCHTSPKK